MCGVAITCSSSNRGFAARRLFGEDVERRRSHLALTDRRGEVVFDDQAAAGAVDDAHPGPCLGKRRRVNHATRLAGERRVQGDEIRALQERVKTHLLDTVLLHACGGNVWVGRQHLHLETVCAFGNRVADPPQADDAERLVTKLDA